MKDIKLYSMIKISILYIHRILQCDKRHSLAISPFIQMRLVLTELILQSIEIVAVFSGSCDSEDRIFFSKYEPVKRIEFTSKKTGYGSHSQEKQDPDPKHYEYS